MVNVGEQFGALSTGSRTGLGAIQLLLRAKPGSGDEATGC